MAGGSFHFFPRLPTELRLEIWRLCLPWRVHELDYPTDEGLSNLEPDSDGSYPCKVIPTAKLNGLPPVITRVCQESRNVANESGSVPRAGFYADLPDDDRFTSFSSVGADDYWLDTKRDTAHINWTPLYQYTYDEQSEGSALGCVAWLSRQVVGHPSIMREWFQWYWFNSDRRYSQNERFEVFDERPSWSVVMHVVIIHANFRDAAQSGLFGLLGDATVQIVSVSDEDKITAFYDFVHEYDPQTSAAGEFERGPMETLRGKLKFDLVKTMGSDKLVSKIHPAIMFRLCTRIRGCKGSKNKDLSSE
ncbi:hypothetical protein N7533_011602 [Penicillium manginii]|uniref:uncharacterized protein n=1 Tax=Penicillium manginii TaxID=203109 RepID=UPI0025498404|nr:uncharacterized protein N7533_011602 [Penicillium manginii]KAJ5742193.1 hypothetical protein N7533_011602 [Penicillium manginii]